MGWFIEEMTPTWVIKAVFPPIVKSFTVWNVERDAWKYKRHNADTRIYRYNFWTEKNVSRVESGLLGEFW